MQTATRYTHIPSNQPYLRRVLSGQLSGRDLLVPFVRRVEEIGPQEHPLLLYALNSSLLWHLAHCPRRQDRETLLAIAEFFQHKLRNSLPELWKDRYRASINPIPFSPVMYPIGKIQDLWFEDLFPKATINWQETFDSLLPGDRTWMIRWFKIFGIQPKFQAGQIDAADLTQQIAGKKQGPRVVDLSELSFIVSLFEENHLFSSGMYVVAEAENPTYRAMMLPKELQQKDETVFPYLQQALAIRGLQIQDNSGEGINNLSLPTRQLGFIGGRPGNRTYFFELDGPDLLMLFVRNRWPIGYGLAQDLSDKGLTPMRMSIFREYRGTSCSSEFLIASEQFAKDRWHTKGFLVDLNLESSEDGQNYLGESIGALVRFYHRNGYWFDQKRKAMVKYI